MFRRILAAALVAGAAVAFLINPLSLKLQVGDPAKPIAISAQARDLSVVCPGALYRAGGSSGTSLEVSRAGAATISGYFANTPNLRLVERRVVQDAPTLSGLLGGSLVDAKSLTVQDPGGVAVQGSSLLAVSQTQVAALSNLAGLAAANCVRPSSDSWLVGGDTSPGRETLLILSNPSDVDSTVNLEILGSGGPVAAPGLTSISVPKSKTTVVPISGVAPNLATFAVHVVSSGGALGAWLQVRTMRGLVAGGVDLIGPSSEQSKSLVVPGIFLRGVTDAAKLSAGNPAYSDLTPMLRITSTSKKQTTVTAQILGANAKSFGTVIQQVVAPNSTLDIPITGLEDGDFVAFIDSTEPVRAAVRFNRTNSKKTDLAWAPAVLPLKNKLVFNAPAGAISKLAIANPGKVSATVTVGSQTVTVPAASSVSVVAPAGRASSISSTVPISASEVIDVGGLVAVIPVLDYKNLGGQLKVLVR